MKAALGIAVARVGERFVDIVKPHPKGFGMVGVCTFQMVEFGVGRFDPGLYPCNGGVAGIASRVFVFGLNSLCLEAEKGKIQPAAPQERLRFHSLEI